MARESFAPSNGTSNSVTFHVFRTKKEEYQGKNEDIVVNLPGTEITGYFQEVKHKLFDEGTKRENTKHTIFLSSESKDSGIGLDAPARLNGTINYLLKNDKIQKGTRLWIKYLGKEEDNTHAFKVDWDSADVYVFTPTEKQEEKKEDTTVTASDLPF